MSITYKKNLKGFTLVEMMVAISIFLIVTLSATGLITTMFSVQRKAQKEQDFVVNLTSSIVTLKNSLRSFTGYTLLDLRDYPDRVGLPCNKAAGFGESIGMLDENGTAYVLTIEPYHIPAFNQHTTRLVFTPLASVEIPGAYTVILPLIKDLSVTSICFKPVGDGMDGVSVIHPRVTVVIQATTINVPSPQSYTFQFTVESRNVVNIQNVYNSTWQ